MNSKLILSKLIAVAATLLFAAAASAQSTSSDLRGSVSAEDGTPIANATIVITHQATGSSRTATTNETGAFFRAGLRVGGPYTIDVTAEGYRPTEIDQVYLSPGAQPPLEMTLETVSETMEEIVVSAQAMPVQDLHNGVGSSFTAEDISNMPSGTRDIISTVLRDPLAHSESEGQLTVAGINPRFNGLSIDGSLQQDDFGLGSNTYATSRSPINIDVVESAALVSTDYGVTAAGFTGGLLNLTVKSGTNEFDGAAYYDWQTDSMFGDTYDGDRTFSPGAIDDKEFGVYVSGPIVKDKLFFLVSYDEFEAASTVDFSNSDANDGIQSGFFTALGNLIEQGTGYNPGTRPDTANTPETSERVLAKFDWNINDYHRASLTYQSTDETDTSVGSAEFESAWYDIPLEIDATTFQLFSDWTDSLSTTLRINKKEFSRGQDCRAGKVVGHIQIENIDIADTVGTPLEGLLTEDGLEEIIGGCDRFRHSNEYSDERTQILAKADYFVGDHLISGGFELEDFSLYNVYLTDSLGSFYFDDLAALALGNASVDYQNGTSNNVDDFAATWGFDKLTFFLQDTVQVTPTLELGFGIRFETYDQSDRPAFDQSILDTYGVDSSNNLDGLDLLLPRASFRWDLGDRTTLSGGFGKFSGGDPKVWISNSFQLPFVRASGDFTGVDPTVVPPSLLTEVSQGTPVPIDVIHPDFEIPADWKASLRLEHSFDIGNSTDYVFTAMYLHSRTDKGFRWINLAQLTDDLPPGVAPDGRPIYANLQTLGIENVTALTNYDDGESNIIALGLGKRYDNGIDFNLSYAYQDVEAVTEGTSSRGISNWRGTIGWDRNNPVPKTSPFQTEHAIKLHFGYEKDFFGDGNATTRFDVFARRVSGDRLAHTFDVGSSNPLFGRASFESPYDTDALYVPTGPSDPAVVFHSDVDQDEFFEYFDKNGTGSGIQKPFEASAGWNTSMDIRIQQTIPGFNFLGNSLGDNNFKIYLNIQNFLNFINDDWGVWHDGPFFLDNHTTQADLISAADLATFGIDDAPALLGDDPRTTCVTQSSCVYRITDFDADNFNYTSATRSVYQIRVGVKFEF